MQSSKKNMERMQEVVPQSDEQSLQHFISNSPWNDSELQDQIGLEADYLLGGHEDSCLLIDESGFQKKGNKSVGVARQWNGRQGKIDNCQVGVYAALSCGDKVQPVAKKLYLPREWTTNKNRCLEAGIPKDKIVFKTKPELALEMVIEARQRGMRFNWVGADGFYGENPGFCNGLEDIGEVFMVDVHKNQSVYIENPQISIPESKGKVGPKPKKPKAHINPIRVDKLVAKKPDTSWYKITLRPSTKGDIEVEIFHTHVWVWDGKEKQARKRHLIVQRTIISKSDYKYSLSNASEDTSVEKLARMQGQRYWIERSFEDGKSEVGMGDYQVRGWRGWHHHMTLVMMAMLFLLKERMENNKSHPLLSCRDIVELLSHFLPRRDLCEEEVLRQMEQRHKKRRSSIDSAYRKQQLMRNNTIIANVTK